MKCMLIPVDGVCVASPDDPAALARRTLDTEALDVVKVRGLQGAVHVLYVHDWGKVIELPINRRAWALYGGSPIYGPAVLARDDELDLTLDVTLLLAEEDFPGPEINAAMDDWLENNP